MSERWQNAVAIIGVAGRFPGADNVEQLWHNLCEGRESIRPIATEELEDGLTEAQRGNGKYVAARALLDNVDMFDAEFFRILPREAEVADPQQRVLMECAWEALRRCRLRSRSDCRQCRGVCRVQREYVPAVASGIEPRISRRVYAVVPGGIVSRAGGEWT